MNSKRVVSAAALTVLLGATIAATGASASPSGSGTDATSSGKTAQGSDFSAAACWTTFNPSFPNGAPMTQVYVNCNPSPIYVASGYLYQGQVNLGGEISCKYVPPGGSYTWYWGSTQQGANYTTVICKYPA